MMFSICSAQTNGGIIPDLIILSDIFSLIATELSFNPDSVFQFKLRIRFASIQHHLSEPAIIIIIIVCPQTPFRRRGEVPRAAWWWRRSYLRAARLHQVATLNVAPI